MSTAVRVLGSGLLAATIALIALFGGSLVAQAAVTEVTGSPGTVSVGADGGAVSIRWRVVNNVAGDTNTSNQSVLVIDGATIATLGGALGGTAGAANSPSFYSETLSISPAQARRIAQSGGVATIQRTFINPAAADVTGSVRIIVSGGAAELSISRVELDFRNGGETAIVTRGGALQAMADIRYAGNGMLDATWQVSALDAVRGSGTFRTIQRVRQPLTAAGPSRLRLESPSLPTSLSGLFEVRLTFDEPKTGFVAPVIRYFVSAETAAATREVTLVSPPPGASLSPQTLFSWRPTPGASAYRVEILPLLSAQESDTLARAWRSGVMLDDGAAPLAGRLVDDGVLETRLSRQNLEGVPRLDGLDWRVRAYDEEGRLIGLSPRRPLGE